MSHPILLFDGVCNLCNQSVNFVIDHDPNGVFKLAALQSEAAKPILAQYQIPANYLDSLILVENGKVYGRSTAALRVAKRLSGLWSLGYIFILIPPPLRNWLYDWVARNRYRWFGKQEACRMPTPELRARFL